MPQDSSRVEDPRRNHSGMSDPTAVDWKIGEESFQGLQCTPSVPLDRQQFVAPFSRAILMTDFHRMLSAPSMLANPFVATNKVNLGNVVQAYLSSSSCEDSSLAKRAHFEQNPNRCSVPAKPQPDRRHASPPYRAQPRNGSDCSQVISRRVVCSLSIFLFAFLSMLGSNKRSTERRAHERQE